MHKATGWKFYWRRYLGWFPIQFCMVCGKPYWGGFPQFRFEKWKIVCIWMPWWMDFCSTECCDDNFKWYA